MIPLYRLKEAPREKGAPGAAIQLAPLQPGLPAVSCPECGRTWSTHTRHLRQELPRDHPLANQPRHAVPPDVLRAMAQQVREALELPEETELLPGTDIGLTRLVCRRPGVRDFEFPGFRTVIITEGVRALFESAGLQGWRADRIRLVQGPRKVRIPKVHELVALGEGIAAAVPAPEVEATCPTCGRVEYRRQPLERIEVEAGSWGDADFVRFCAPLATGIYVSERVKEVLESGTLENWSLTPLEEEIADALQRARRRDEAAG